MLTFNQAEPGNSTLPDANPSDSGGFLATLGGLVGYAGRSYIDSQFPTGNQNPGAVVQKVKSDDQIEKQKPFPYKHEMILGAYIVAGIIVLYAGYRTFNSNK